MPLFRLTNDAKHYLEINNNIILYGWLPDPTYWNLATDFEWLVSKWFMRDKEFGWNSPDLILERGQYDVSATDIEAASQTKTGIATLGDRGFELIDNTFVIANDITYVDHEKNAQIAKDVLSGVGALFAIVSGQEDNLITSLATVGAVISDMIAGFTVKVTSYLYQLDWSEEIADIYYNEYYIDRPQADSASIVQYLNDPEIAAKIEKYEKDNSTFSLSYVGKYQAKSAKPVLRGLYNPTDVFKKVCARAIDNNSCPEHKACRHSTIFLFAWSGRCWSSLSPERPGGRWPFR